MASPLSIKSAKATDLTRCDTYNTGCGGTLTTKTKPGSQQNVASTPIDMTVTPVSENTCTENKYSPVRACQKPTAKGGLQQAAEIPPCTATDKPDIFIDAITEIRDAAILVKIYAVGLANIIYNIRNSSSSALKNIRSEKSAEQQSSLPTTTANSQPPSSQDKCTTPDQLSDNDFNQVDATHTWASKIFDTFGGLLVRCQRLVANNPRKKEICTEEMISFHVREEEKIVDELARQTKAIKNGIIVHAARKFDNKIFETGYGNKILDIVEACNDPSKIAAVIQRFGKDGLDVSNYVKEEKETLSQEAKYAFSFKDMMAVIRNMTDVMKQYFMGI